MISSSFDGRVKKAIASEVVDLGIIPSPMKPKTQKLVFTASLFDAHSKVLKRAHSKTFKGFETQFKEFILSRYCH